MKKTPYYISIFNTHPWQSNVQYEVKCSTRTDAVEFAKVLSALNGVEARVSTYPGFKDSDTIVYAKFKKDGNIISFG